MKRCLFASVNLALVVAGCALGPEKVRSVKYTVAFPSKDAALYTEQINVYAFKDYACSDIIRDRMNGQLAQQPLAGVSGVDVCSALSGTAPSFDLEFGEVSLLVLGTNSSASPSDVLIGCAKATNGDGDFPVSVQLSVFPRTPAALIPASSCASVQAKCNNQC